MANQAVSPFFRLYLTDGPQYLSALGETGFEDKTTGRNTIYTIDVTSTDTRRIVDEHIANLGYDYERVSLQNVVKHNEGNNPSIRILRAPDLERIPGRPNSYRLDFKQFRAIVMQSRAIDQFGGPRYRDPDITRDTNT